MRGTLTKTVIAAVVAVILATGAVVSYGWKLTLAGLALVALIVLAGLAVRALRRGSDKVAEIFHEEIDGPDPRTRQRDNHQPNTEEEPS